MTAQVQTIPERPVLVREVITCKCGTQITLWVKPGEVVCITCPKCGQTLTAVAPMSTCVPPACAGTADRVGRRWD